MTSLFASFIVGATIAWFVQEWRLERMREDHNSCIRSLDAIHNSDPVDLLGRGHE